MKTLPAHLGSLVEIVEQQTDAMLTWRHGRDKVLVDVPTARMLCAVLGALHGDTYRHILELIEHSPAVFHQVVATARRCVY